MFIYYNSFKSSGIFKIMVKQCFTLDTKPDSCPVSLGCRIHQLHLCRGKTPPSNECPRYDTKQSYSEVPVLLELQGMQSTLSLSLLPGPLWPGMVTPDRALSIGQIAVNCIFMLN